MCRRFNAEQGHIRLVARHKRLTFGQTWIIAHVDNYSFHVGRGGSAVRARD